MGVNLLLQCTQLMLDVRLHAHQVVHRIADVRKAGSAIGVDTVLVDEPPECGWQCAG